MRCLLQRVFVFIFITLFSLNMNGQEKLFKMFTTRDGLPTNNIFKVRFDQKGFLWIAHDKGISRFDGTTFRTYSNPAQKSNVYTDVYIAPDGKVWMTNLGLQAFYIENDQMKLYREFDLILPPANMSIGFLDNGNLIFNAEGGLVEVNPKLNTEKNIGINGPVQSFYTDGKTVYFYNFITRRIYTYNKVKDSLPVFADYPPVFATDSLVVCSYNVADRLYVYNKFSGAKTAEILLGGNYNYCEPNNGKLIVYTNGSIHEIEFTGTTYTDRMKMTGKSFTHNARDMMGNEWYSTLNEGLMFVPFGDCRMLGHQEKHIFYKLTNFRGNAYVLTQDNKFIQLDSYRLKPIADYKGLLGSRPVIMSKNLGDKHLIFGHSDFIVLDQKLDASPYIYGIAMKDISADNKGNFYLATSGSIYIHNLNGAQLPGNRFKNYKGNISKLQELENVWGRFNCVAYDTGNSVLYYGGVPGFFMKLKGEQPVEIRDNGNQIYATAAEQIDSFLLTGTIQSGLYVMKKGYPLYNFRSDNSTIGNTVIKILNYEGNAWVLTEKGLHVVNPGPNKVNTFTSIGILDLKNCTDFTLSNGLLYLISAQNIYSIELQEFLKPVIPIPFYFKSVQLGNKVIYDPESLRFSHNENSLTVSIDLPAASVLGNIELEYTLDNFQWFTLSKGQTNIFLNQLKPGSYTLNVRQKGMKTGHTLYFVIAAPFWTRWWFISFSVMTILFFSYLIYRGRIRRYRERADTELEKMKLEKALHQNILSRIKAQMNPHFLFNALNTIQSYIYLNEKKQAIGYLNKFSVLTRKILDQSNFETISLSEEYETLDLYLQLEKMRFENTMDYSIRFENIEQKDQIKIPPMLIQPYVENAVKHGLMHLSVNRKLDIIFRFDQNNTQIQVVVDDNGIGRKRAEEINRKRKQNHVPFSTEANRTRLEILNRDKMHPISVSITDKTDDFGNPAGTRVQINIPVL